MIFENFHIHSVPHIIHATCKCREKLQEVSNGLASVAMFCPKCESVYVPRLVKVAKRKVKEHFLKQCRAEVALSRGKGETK